MFFRKITTKKNGREYVYVKLIENYRQAGKVKQRVIANFGSMENLSADRINYLIASLKKLHNEVTTSSNDEIPLELLTKANDIKDVIKNCQIKRSMLPIFGETMYEIAEAMLLKAIMAGEVKKPVQEVCKDLGLVESTSLQFYNIMKRLGQSDVKEALLKNRIFFESGNENNHKITIIHIFKSYFEGQSFNVDTTNNVYLPENYRKPIYIAMALNYQGKLLDYECAEEIKEVPGLVNCLFSKFKKYLNGEFVVLDEENCIKRSTGFLVAKKILENSNQLTIEDEKVLKTNRYSQISDNKIKEIKARLARVSAGLETLKADVLVGKIKKETMIRKKAEQVIKTNQCEGLVSYNYSEAKQLFSYSVKEEILKQKQHTRSQELWRVAGPMIGKIKDLNDLHIQTDQFYQITDQLNIPPINLYVDYHYSPEIISGHIQLEILKAQVKSAMKQIGLGGDAII
ncbi:hypothetical protein Dred_1424 [Desulforamulus reducens MI-1]|uniref:Uncharacterized protein n=1 Tax=Desulforamulus reducens (strain ATCC BAA-1160 / DSM 100696 / MI-1) TaxID=349161 RepID=A4J4F1_DESRM|nr:hypothetical protein [Desulforamulus reducens]ABO49954.1 hypothetical protein Dred_1424 [Desulforamulus reducens MI-1]